MKKGTKAFLVALVCLSCIVVVFLVAIQFDIVGVNLGFNNKSPIAVYEASTTEGYASLSVDFNCSAYDSDGSLVSFHWDFGDGINSTEKNPAHTFKERGKSYTVVLTVIDDMGASASSSRIITTLPNKPPSALANASIDKGTLPLTVPFTGIGEDDDGNITAYHWDFGDDSTSNLQNPTHTFEDFGIYEIVLTVTDNDGAANNDVVIVDVRIPVVTDQDLELIEWVGEKIDVLGPLCSTVWQSVTSLLTYTMDEKGRELMELAEQYQEDINHFSDLSEPFVTFKYKFTTVLENYERVGRFAWGIVSDLNNYDYDMAELGIRCFPGTLEDVTESLEDVTEIISYLEK